MTFKQQIADELERARDRSAGSPRGCSTNLR